MTKPAEHSAAPSLFVLRYLATETHKDSDYGPTFVCERYDDIAFCFTRDGLDVQAANLNSGHRGADWSLERTEELRALHPGYDSFADGKYVVVDISDLLIPTAEAT